MIITITGPSGIGKGHLTAQLQSVLGAHIIPWTTTRKPRFDDKKTGNRHFVTREEFEWMQSSGLLIGIQELHGAKYGLELRLLEFAVRNEIYICEVNSKNLETLLPVFPHRFSIALVTDKLKLLEERIVRREPEIEFFRLTDRLEIASKEIELIKSMSFVFHLCINIDIYHESVIASVVIDAIRKGENV